MPEILVLLGVFFYSTIRLLPSISKIVRAVQNIKYNYVVIDVIVGGLKEYKEAFEKSEESEEKRKNK